MFDTRDFWLSNSARTIFYSKIQHKCQFTPGNLGGHPRVHVVILTIEGLRPLIASRFSAPKRFATLTLCQGVY